MLPRIRSSQFQTNGILTALYLVTWTVNIRRASNEIAALMKTSANRPNGLAIDPRYIGTFRTRALLTWNSLLHYPRRSYRVQLKCKAITFKWGQKKYVGMLTEWKLVRLECTKQVELYSIVYLFALNLYWIIFQILSVTNR